MKNKKSQKIFPIPINNLIEMSQESVIQLAPEKSKNNLLKIIQKMAIQKGKQKKQIWQQQKQSFILYIIVIISQVYTVAEVFVMILLLKNNVKVQNVFWVTFSTSLIRILIFGINSYSLADKKKILYAYTLLDMLGALNISTAIVVIGFELSFSYFYNQAFDTLSTLNYILTFILYIFYVGNFRLMVVVCKWGIWRVIIYKIKLYLSCIFYVALGMYFSFSQLVQPCDQLCVKDEGINTILSSCNKCVNIDDCCTDYQQNIRLSFSLVEKFMILFLSAALASTSQFIARVSDRDGVNEYQVHYTLNMAQDLQQQQQKLIKNRRLHNIHDKNLEFIDQPKKKKKIFNNK